MVGRTHRRTTLATVAAVTATLVLLAGCGSEAPRKLTTTDVTGIPAGSAGGTNFSGLYLIKSGAIEECACSGNASCSTAQVNVGRTFTATEDAGRIQFVFETRSDVTYVGGVDADGAYRAGAMVAAPGDTEYLFMSGRIHVGSGGQPLSIDTTQEYSGDTTDFTCDVRASFTSDYQASKK